MSLAVIQQDFRAYLRSGNDEIAASVADGARHGLAVYRHAFRANLIACLRDTFTKSSAWLGEADFEIAALEHIALHPPSSWTLSDYGEGFPETLARIHPRDPEIEELAWLDRALRRAFDGPDSRVQDRAAMADVDWESAVLSVAPTLALRPITTNGAAIWSAMADGLAPPAAAALTGFAGLAVWRRDLTPYFRTLDEAEYRALEQVALGQSFGQLCAGLASDDQPPEIAAILAGGWLARWLSDGIVTGVKSTQCHP
jgi:hypothetical protein